jgi:hypothetical protein
MRRVAAFVASLALCAGASATVVKNGGELADACSVFAGQPEGFGKTPEGLRDPCRKFLEGYFRTLKDKNAAELKAKAEQVNAPAPPSACVRMPDVLTYRDFAGRIGTFAAANPQDRAGSPVALAQKTLETNFPCPEPERPR